MSSTFPEDPLAPEQWHLLRLGNIQRIWAEFTGLGVSVGVYDDGIQYTHPDLNDNYDPTKQIVIGATTFDGANVLPIDGHGTAVAGLIAAEANGEGTVGIAFGAQVTGVNIFDAASALFINAAIPTGFHQAIAQSSRFDVVNNSWGSTPFFDATQSLDVAGSFAALTNAGWSSAAATGRGGLGTVVVKSAGNDARDAQGDGLNASRFTITVAALGDSGFASSYSNHGASVLIAAPGSEFTANGGLGAVTTDLLGTDGYNLRSDFSADSDYTDDFGGTSAAGPIVAAVVALMLDANPNLGWRDVQNILAASATHTGSGFNAPTLDGTFENGFWYFNNADHWNGGGMHAHANYGFGALNAYNAVRMAEVWTLFGTAQTSANEVTASGATEAGPLALPDLTNVDVLTDIATAIEIEHVSLTVTFSHANFIDLDLYLTSAEGTVVRLLDGTAGTVATATGGLTWTFGIDTLRGETSNGTWRVTFSDVVGGNAGSVTSVAITAYGRAVPVNDVFHFTDEFASLAFLAGQGTRRTMTDTDGGIDWVNASAVTNAAIINLNANAYSSIGGGSVRTGATGIIENIVSGDGNDLLIGNAADNELRGMRGVDTMRGGAGNDTYHVDDSADRVTEGAGGGTDTVVTSVSYALTLDTHVEQIETTNSLGNATIHLTGNDFNQVMLGNAAGNILLGFGGVDVLYGLDGDDSLLGGSGNDELDGGNGNDTMAGGAGGDVIRGEAGTRDTASYAGGGAVRVALDGSLTFTGDAAGDTLSGIEDLWGSALADTLRGDGGLNALSGFDGDDILGGMAGDDSLRGGLGADTLIGGAGKDRLTGNEGADRFVWTAANESAPTSTGRDVLADFTFGDVLDFLSFDANALLAGVQNFIYRGVTATTGIANAGELWSYVFGGNSYLIGGIDAVTTRDFQVEFTGLVNFGASSFLGTLFYLQGGATNDTLLGTGGADTLEGGGGGDSISGGNGADSLAGGEGADTLIGGAGKDRLSGGAGDDIFVFASHIETPASAAGRDVVTDWNMGDRIDLSVVDANTTLAGKQSFTFGGTPANTGLASAGQLFVFQSGGNTFASGGVDGDGNRDFLIELTGLHTLSAASFIL